MSNIRFVDSLNVGAYTIDGSSGGGGVTIEDNVNNYLLTATGFEGVIQGEAQLQFDSLNLAIGGSPSGTARLEIYHTGSVDNLMLIKNTNTNTGIQVDNAGRFQLLEFSSLPTAVEGGIIYSSNEFYVGI